MASTRVARMITGWVALALPLVAAGCGDDGNGEENVLPTASASGSTTAGSATTGTTISEEDLTADTTAGSGGMTFPATYLFDCIDIIEMGDSNGDGMPDGDAIQVTLLENTWASDIAAFKLNIMLTVLERDDTAGTATIVVGSGIGTSATDMCLEPTSLSPENAATFDAASAQWQPSNAPGSCIEPATGDGFGGTYTFELSANEAIYIYAEDDDGTIFNCVPGGASPNAVPLHAVTATVTLDANEQVAAGRLTGCLVDSEAQELCSCLGECAGAANPDCGGCPDGSVPLATLLGEVGATDDCTETMGETAYELTVGFVNRRLAVDQPMTCGGWKGGCLAARDRAASVEVMDKAATLVEAINRFSPQPIEFGVDSVNESFYVKRSDDPLRDLRVQLLSSPTGIDKTLLAGHRGTGKSTELNRLGADPEIQRHFEVVRFSVKDSLELTDLDHVDLLFTMVARTYEALSTDEAPLDLKAETVASLEGWRSRVIERMEEKVKGAGGELSVGGEGQGLGFFGKLGARLRWERTTRESTRQVIQPRIQEFLGDVTDFFLDVQVALDEEGKRLLLLIEDLDKLPYVQQAKTLFGDMGKYLTDPPVRIVYTVPIALHYSKNFMQIAGRFGENVLVPNVRLASHDDEGRAYEEGIAIMRAFVAQRMDCSLIDDDALAEAVTLGGGLFQQMQRVMQKACVKAVGREMARVTKAEVLEGASDLRAAFERPLTREDISILDDASVSKRVSGDDATLELLHSLHLMEYRNAERWCDVNPLLRPTLKRWGAEAARSKSKAKAKAK